MLASAQTVLHCAAEPIVAAVGFPGKDCRIGRQRAIGLLFEEDGISIAGARAGAVEASHLQ
jgi:hypothetical protein